MYIGPWQEYVLGKALAQAKLSSTPNTRPATAAGEFPDLPAAHRLARPCSSLSAPSEFGGGSVRATARAQRARPGPSAGGGRGRGSQLGKKQQLQRMQTMYGMRGNTPGARAVQLAASALDDDEGDELTPLPETRRSPIARDAPASQQHPPSAARFPPRPAPPDAVAIGAQLLGWAPRAYSGAHAEASSPLGYDSHVSTRAVHSPVVRGGHAQPQHRAPAEAALLLASTGGEIESWRQAALPPPWHEGAQWRAQPCSEPPRSGSRAATPPAAPAPALARGAPFARADTTGLSRWASACPDFLRALARRALTRQPSTLACARAAPLRAPTTGPRPRVPRARAQPLARSAAAHRSESSDDRRFGRGGAPRAAPACPLHATRAARACRSADARSCVAVASAVSRRVTAARCGVAGRAPRWTTCSSGLADWARRRQAARRPDLRSWARTPTAAA